MSYIDKKVKYNKIYYYRVLIVKKNGKKIYSKKGHGKTIKINAAKNLAYIKKTYPNVCTDVAQNMNNYAINGIYTPVKYKFDGKTMEIHVYLDFVKYTNSNTLGTDGEYIYTKTAASKTEGIEQESYISLFKKGIKKGFDDVIIEGSDKDFTGCNFKTKLVIHVKGEGETFQTNQKYVEVLIGGDCPNCEDGEPGNHWYHTWYNWNSKDAYKDNPEDYMKYYVIFMPTNQQTQANNGARQQNRSAELYKSTSAHELGHILGLYDAYDDEEFGIDRCVDCKETGYEYEAGSYDNLMKYHTWKEVISANDLEMMLGAYSASGGLPWNEFQAYKTFYIEHPTYEENFEKSVWIKTKEEDDEE